jgi:hypothetical protein
MYLEGFKLSGMSYATYVSGEGWHGDLLYMAGVNIQDDYLPTSNVYSGPGSPDATGMAVSSSASNAYEITGMNHHMIFSYTNSSIVLEDTIFSAYQKNNFEFSVDPSTLEFPTTRFRHEVPNDLGVASDYQAVAFVELTYPHTPNLEGGILL